MVYIIATEEQAELDEPLINTFMKNILLYIWQLPQNLLGLILVLFYRPDVKIKASNGNVVYFTHKMPGGISLGRYSIINKGYYRYDAKQDAEKALALNVTKHEALGHGAQSRLLGPLYLLVIGLPSIVWATLYGPIIPYTKNGYYVFYTEKWADKLGGVIRN